MPCPYIIQRWHCVGPWRLGLYGCHFIMWLRIPRTVFSSLMFTSHLLNSHKYSFFCRCSVPDKMILNALFLSSEYVKKPTLLDDNASFNFSLSSIQCTKTLLAMLMVFILQSTQILLAILCVSMFCVVTTIGEIFTFFILNFDFVVVFVQRFEPAAQRHFAFIQEVCLNKCDLSISF